MSSSVTNEYIESETLNLPISEAKVTTAVKRLKNGKACGGTELFDSHVGLRQGD